MSLKHEPASEPLHRTLTRLSLSKNKILDFPEGMEALVSLRYLYLKLSDRRVYEPQIRARLGTRYLYVGENPMKRLPPSLGASPFLVEATAGSYRTADYKRTSNLSVHNPQALR